MSLLLNIAFKNLLNVDELIMNTLADQLTFEQIEKVLDTKEKIKWLEFISIPLFLTLKLVTVSAIINAACFFFDKEIKYRQVFNLVTKSEFIFLFVIVLRIIWFYFFNTEYELEDIQNFYPLSVLSVTGHENLSPWFIYPLQTLNLFEVAYFFALSYLLSKELNTTIVKGFTIIVGGYGISLVIWVVCVMFIVLNFS